MESKKLCSKCCLLKTVSEFYFVKRQCDYAAACKKCKNKQDSDRHKKKTFGKPRKKIASKYDKKEGLRICVDCGKEKEFSEFYRSYQRVVNRCKVCSRLKHKEIRETEDYQKYHKEYRKRNREKSILYAKINRSKYRGRYSRDKIKLDINFRIRNRLRSRLKRALRKNGKGKSSTNAILFLGCSIKEFVIYIESKFQSGMTWDNWGNYGWHMDHKKPLSSFDLTDDRQLEQACHYTNIQPLWWFDNLSKGNKLI